MEISSENDLFFYYSHNVDEAAFKEIQSKQKLMIEFSCYHSILIKMLNNCIKEPHM
jgi:superoxide dismutase